MTETAGTVLTALLRRVRDLQAADRTRATALSLLNHAQRIVNAATDQVYETITVSIPAQQVFHSLQTIAPNCIDLKDVKQGGRSLSYADFKEFFYLNRGWARTLGPRIEAYSQLGLDVLITYPALEIAASVDLTYVRMTAELVDETIVTQIPDDTLPVVLDLAEASLLIQQRDFATAIDTTNRFLKTVQTYKRDV